MYSEPRISPENCFLTELVSLSVFFIQKQNETKQKKKYICTSDNWKLWVVGLPLMTILQRLTLKRVQQSSWNCAFLYFICRGCSWYAAANPGLWSNVTGWTKVTVTHSFSFLIPFKTKGKNLSDFCLRACYIATVRALSGLGLCLLPNYWPNIKIATVISAMDHKPLDLTGGKWREERKKEGIEEGRKEKENPSKAYPPNKIIYLVFPFQEMTLIHPWNCLSQKPGWGLSLIPSCPSYPLLMQFILHLQYMSFH